MTIDTWGRDAPGGDAGDASATEPATGTCAVFEPTVASRSRRTESAAARTSARSENADDTLEAV